jgi:hypothetical protein
MTITFSVNDKVKGSKGKYTITQELETGGLAGKVYRAHTPQSGTVIIKLNESIDEMTILNRVQVALSREGLIDGIVNPIDKLPDSRLGTWKGHVEGLAPGNSLGDIWEESTINEPDALHIAIDVAKVLRACANSSIAYRDVKPLKHVFWKKDPWQVTVIDWNAAQLKASPDELRKDLLIFCRMLPVFFTGRGASRDDPNLLHPLEWDPKTQRDREGHQLSYATWHLLAQYSLGWGMILAPELRDVIHVPFYGQDNDLKEKIVKAWNEVIGSLELAQKAWQTETNKEPGIREGNNNLVNQMCSTSIQVLKGEKPPETENQWLQLLQQASEETQNIGLSAYKPWRVNNSQFEGKLRRGRLLIPQDARFALTWTAYVIWDEIKKGQKWPLLIDALIEKDWKQSQQVLDSIGENSEEIIPKDTEENLQDLWWGAIGRLKRETSTLSLLEEARQKENPEQQLALLGQAEEQSSNHPLVEILREKVTEKVKAKEEIERIRRNLDQAIDNQDINSARDLLSKLGDMAPKLARKYEGQIQLAEAEKDLRSRTKNALKSWDKDEITAVYTDWTLIEREKPTKGISQTLERLQERLNDIENLNSELATIKSDLETLEVSTYNLLQSHQRITQLQGKYPNAPQVEELYLKWRKKAQEYFDRLLDNARALLEEEPQDANLDDQIQRLKDQVSELETAQRLAEVLKNEKYAGIKSGLRNKLKKANDRYKALRQRAEDALREGENLVELWENIPPMLKEELEGQFKAAKNRQEQEALALQLLETTPDSIDDWIQKTQKLLEEYQQAYDVETSARIEGLQKRLSQMQNQRSIDSRLEDFEKDIRDLTEKINGIGQSIQGIERDLTSKWTQKINRGMTWIVITLVLIAVSNALINGAGWFFNRRAIKSLPGEEFRAVIVDILTTPASPKPTEEPTAQESTPMPTLTPTPPLPTPTPTPTPMLRVLPNSQATIYNTPSSQQPIWQYNFQGQALSGQPISAEARKLKQEGNMIQIQQDFIISSEDLEWNAAQNTLVINSDTTLRSSRQYSQDPTTGQKVRPQLGVTLSPIPVTQADLKENPDSPGLYIVALKGWAGGQFFTNPSGGNP